MQFVAAPFSILFGWLSKKIGNKSTILIGLGIYTVVAAYGYFVSGTLEFWILGFVVAMAQGGSQALSRSLYASMSPKAKSAEFFGFYDVSSKFAGIIGPTVFGLVGASMGSSRYAILALIPLFVIGGILLMAVDVKQGVAVAKAEDVAMGLRQAVH